MSEEAFQYILARLSREEGTLLERVCVSLAVELGANVSQFCQLRARDYLAYETSETTIHQIDLPRSKKSDGYAGRRRRPLSPRLGRLIGQYLNATSEARATPRMEDPLLLLTDTGKPMTDKRFSAVLQRFARRVGLESVMDGNLTAQRLRRTYATRLVAEGGSQEDLVDLLDHTDGQNVGVYFEMRGDAVSRIDKAVGEAMEAVVARFEGRIVDSESDAYLGDRPEQRIEAGLETGDIGIGTCGRDILSEGLCGLHPPHSCYTCPLFQPWKGADHEGFAATIRSTRDELLGLEGGDARGRVIGQFNGLLKTIEEVAQACKEPPPAEPARRRKKDPRKASPNDDAK